ncbi:Uncharacterised protein [uncultured archaeon]|nr:Uncharacterised protein [uncultured archaeon]
MSGENDKLNLESGFGTTPETVIWGVGDIGGGTRYFSESNMIGLYRKLKDDIKNGLSPDHIVFNGEVLPKIPRWITRGGMSDSRVLAGDVEDLNDAAIYMKAHMSRIVNLVSESGHPCGITYVMSESDRENITNKYDLLVYCYKSKPKELAGFLLNVKEKVKLEQGILDNHNAMFKAEKDDGKKKYFKSKIRVQESYVRDYKNIEKGYTELIRKWVEDNSELTTQQILEKFEDYKDPEVVKVLMCGMPKEKKAETVLYYGDDKAFVKALLLGISKEKNSETLAYLKEKYDDATKKLNAAKKQVKQPKSDDSGKTTQEKKVQEKALKEAEEDFAKFRFLQNELKKGSFKKIANFEKKIAKESSEGAMEAAIMHFANTIPGNSKQAKISYVIAKQEIKTKLKDVFGRHTHVEIQEDDFKIQNINTLKVMTTHKLSTDSTAVARRSERGLASVVHGAPERVDLLISAHSAKASEEIIPVRNFSNEYTYSVTLPFFVDAQKLKQARNEEIKTPLTKSAGQMPSSGAYKMVHNGYSFETTFYSSDYLKVLSNIEKDEQISKLAANLKRLEPLKVEEVSLDKTDRLQISSRLCGDEISDKEILNKLLILNNIDPSNKKMVRELISKIETQETRSHVPEVASILSGRFLRSPANEQLQEVNFAIISDSHVGSNGLGMATTELIDALQKPMIASFAGKPFVSLFLGDNIEANIKNFKDRTDIENDPANVDQFRDYLIRDCSMSPESEKFRTLVDKYKASLLDQRPVHNYATQAKMFARSVLPIVNASERTVIVSGNHPNQTPADQSMDESIMLKEHFMAQGDYIKGKLSELGVKEDKIKTVPGGNFGLREFALYDKNVDINDQTTLKVGSDTLTFSDTTISGQPFWLAHKLPRDAHKSVGEMGLIGTKIGGHIHHLRKEIVNNSLQLSVPALRGLLTFPNEAGFCVTDSTRGAVLLKLHYEQGKPDPLVSSTRVIMIKELKERGMLPDENARIAEFKLARRSSPAEKVMVATVAV